MGSLQTRRELTELCSRPRSDSTKTVPSPSSLSPLSLVTQVVLRDRLRRSRDTFFYCRMAVCGWRLIVAMQACTYCVPLTAPLMRAGTDTERDAEGHGESTQTHTMEDTLHFRNGERSTPRKGNNDDGQACQCLEYRRKRDSLCQETELSPAVASAMIWFGEETCLQPFREP